MTTEITWIKSIAFKDLYIRKSVIAEINCLWKKCGNKVKKFFTQDVFVLHQYKGDDANNNGILLVRPQWNKSGKENALYNGHIKKISLERAIVFCLRIFKCMSFWTGFSRCDVWLRDWKSTEIDIPS